MKRTHQQYLNELNISNSTLIPIEKYNGALYKLKHKCVECNQVCKAAPNNILNLNQKCPTCYPLIYRKKSDELYMSQVQAKENAPLPVEKYINDYTEIKHQCQQCGYTWKIRPSNILQGQRCPKCKRSRGEEQIEKFLIKHDIEFETQKSFKDLYYKCDKHPLRFDFYLPKNNLLVEYNGIQHYKLIEYFGGQKAFNERQERDALKYDFCKTKNINLLIIKYTSKNFIPQLLFNKIKND